MLVIQLTSLSFEIIREDPGDERESFAEFYYPKGKQAGDFIVALPIN